VRENLIDNYSCEALALYLFLLTVADEDGVSWYSDAAICRRLRLVPEELGSARGELVGGKMLAYRRPHYQVLELPRRAPEKAFRGALAAALKADNAEAESGRRQPVGTDGLGVSLYPSCGIYRRPDDACDSLPLGTIIAAMAGGAR